MTRVIRSAQASGFLAASRRWTRRATVAAAVLALFATMTWSAPSLAQGRGEQSRPEPRAPSLKPPSAAAVKKLTASLVKVQAHIPPDAIADWRDPDDLMRLNGAEATDRRTRLWPAQRALRNRR